MFPNKLWHSSKKIREHYGAADSRTLHLTGVTGAVSIFLGLGKIVSGMMALSVFACMNGGYTLGMALARYCALYGAAKTTDQNGQHKYYRFSGGIMIVASVLYVCYSLWAIWNPKTVSYGDIIAITIATITFIEIGLNVRGMIKYRKATTPLLHALKIISLGTSLISLVLTQAAILSFADEIQNPSVNGLLGAITGIIAALLGCYMLWRIKKLEHKNT